MKILSKLHEQHLIGPLSTPTTKSTANMTKEPFFPFDLDALSSATLVLILVKVACPAIIIDQSCIDTADNILSSMIAKGCVLANTRKQEMEELQRMAITLTEMRGGNLRTEDRGQLQTPAMSWHNAFGGEGEVGGQNTLHDEMSNLLALDWEHFDMTGDVLEQPWFSNTIV
jgi:hypothetical protein